MSEYDQSELNKEEKQKRENDEMKSTKATNGVIGVDHQTEPGNNEMEEEISEQVVKEIYQRSQQAKQFHVLYEKFQNQAFFSRQFYFILSTKWLKKWKRYVGLQDETKNLKQLYERSRPTTINANIIDYNNLPIQNFQEYQHYNIMLVEGLAEERDFIYINQQVWDFFKNKYQPYQIKRFVVETFQGKHIELYYQKIHLIPISQTVLKDLKSKRINKFLSFDLQFSKFVTNIEFKKIVIPLILKQLQKSYLHQNFKGTRPQNCRIWFLQPQVSEQNFFTNLFFSTQKNQMYLEHNQNFSIFLNGNCISREKNFYEYDISPSSIFIMEMQSPQWCFFNKKIICDALCICKNKANSRFVCECKNIVYCSALCKQGHYKHKKKCEFAENSKNKIEERKVPILQTFKYEKKPEILERKVQILNGKVGLSNLGNTCFMNSGLQCLSNIKQITTYFVNNEHAQQINRENPLGTKGKLSNAYANLIQKMWCNNNISSVSPSQLKRQIAIYQPIFVGYSQHDSGQLITYLLDGLHEDLNRILKKPYIQNKDYDGRPQKIVADEQWDNFSKRNRSIITDNMYGQYRSTLDCLICSYRSIQFDPFLMCSLPIPSEDSYKKLTLNLQNSIFNEQKLTMVFKTNEMYTLKDLIQEIKVKKKLPPQSKLITFRDNYIIGDNKKIDDLKLNYTVTPPTIRILTQQQLVQNKIGVFIEITCRGYMSSSQYSIYKPIYFYFSKDLTAKQFHKRVFYLFNEITDVKNFEQFKNQEKPQIKLLFQSYRKYERCYLCEKMCNNCEFPYNDKTLGQLFKEQQYFKTKIFFNRREDEMKKKLNTIKNIKDTMMSSSVKLNLDTCFELFEMVETLDENNTWYCPKCKDHVRAKKQMKIYKAPKILVLCLKRFKRKRYYSQKNQTFIRYPLQFDLKKHLINPDLPPINEKMKQETNQQAMYELFGVSNHSGGTGSGHYTAYCKNIIDGRWYYFNDSSVREVDPKSVQTSNAYVLFYRRV